MPDKKVTSKFRAQLRSQAQTINPVVMVGHEGISEGVLEALDQALTCNELVKVRFQDFKDLTKDLANELADKTKSLLVSVTGFTAVFYRENPTKLNKK